MKDEYSTFFLAFVGKDVIITTRSSYSVSNGPNKETMPIFYEGLLLDFDDEFYYLGKTIGQIDSAVPKNVVLNISLSAENDVFGEILKQMPDPDGFSEIN